MFSRATASAPLELTAAIVPDPLVVSPATPVTVAIALMSGIRSSCATAAANPLENLYLEARSSCVVVIDQEQVIGILTERDVVRLSTQPRVLETVTVGQVMTQAVVTLRQSIFTDLFSAINLLQQRQIRHLPILDHQDRLVGLITHESLRHVAQPINLLRLRRVEEVMTRRVICATPDCLITTIAEWMAKRRVSSVVIVERRPGDLESANFPEIILVPPDPECDLPDPLPEASLLVPVGMITERDLVQFQALGLGQQPCRADVVMTTFLVTVSPEDSLWTVQQLMDEQLIRRLAVTGAQGELLGIVTQTSLLQALNPLELYNLAGVLEQKVLQLEAEKMELLQNRATELESQVQARTAALEAKAQQERLLNTIADQIRSSLDLEQILTTTVREIHALLGSDRVIIYQFRPDGSGIVIAEAIAPASRSIIHQEIHDSCLTSAWFEAYRTGKIRIIHDIDTAELTPCHRDLLKQLQIRAKLLVPLIVEGHLWGVMLASYQAQPHVWSSDEIELVRQVSLQVAIALQQATVYQRAQTELAERKKVEASLHLSEQRYATLVEAVPVGIFRTNMQGRCIYANQRYCQITGLSLETALKRGWRQGLHPEDCDRVLREWYQAVTENRSCQIECRFQHPDGTVKWVYAQSAVERDKAGRVIGYVGMVTDISDRKQAELALATSEAQSRSILALLPDYLFRIDARGIFREIITYQRQIALLPADLDPVGMTMKEVLPADIARLQQGYLDQAMATGALGVYEQQVQDGTHLRWEEVRVVRSGEDEALFMVRDITDRKQAEQALAASEAQSRAILATIPDLMFRVGSDGVYRGYVTPHREFGLVLKDQDLTGQTLTNILPPDLAARQQDYLQRAIATGELQVYEQTLIIDGRRQDEEVRVVKSNQDEALFMVRDITNRKQAERALQDLNQRLEQNVADRTAKLLASEAQIRAIVEAIPDLLLKVRRDGTRLYYVREPHQTHLESHINLSELMPPAVKQQKLRMIEQAIATGHLQVYEHQFQVADRTIHEEIRIVALNPNEALIIVRDITDRKQTEQALRESQQFIQTVIDTIPISICWKDRNSVYLGCNRQLANFLHLSSTLDIVGKTDFDLSATEVEAHAYRADDCQVITSGQAKLGIEETITLDSGEQRWLETHKAPLRDWQGQVMGLVVMFQDITDRKRADLQLQASEAKFRNLVEHANDIIYTLSATGIFTYVSPNWQEILGHATSEVVHQPFAPFVHPDDVPKCYAFLGHILETGQKQRGVEYRVRHKNGEWRWHTSSATPQWDSNGQISSYLGIAHDITDRKLTEFHLQRTNQELARATRLKDEFLANMSHELRTPLNAILGLTEGLLEGVFGTISKPQGRTLTTIEQSGTHLLELINDILDVAKIEAGQMDIECLPTSVSSLCQSSLTFIKQQAMKKRIQVQTQLPPTLPDLIVDERRIRQVLINLLTNAVKFTHEGGTITLAAVLPPQVEAPDDQNYLRLTVIDTGIGIAPAHIDKLFQPFIQIDSALNRKYEGTGLGLALVKRIVELHGGQVTVTSEVGVGSCFALDLPCAAPGHSSSPSAPALTNGDPGLDQPALTTSPLILLAEDNEANISTISNYLRAKGYRLLVAKNGREAITLAQTEHPNLILMDIQMPEIDGLEAMQQIRANPNLVTVPIIALTALAMSEDRDRCLAAGANQYISKPIRLKQLAATIHQFLS